MPAATRTPQRMSGGIQSYYQTKIEAAELLINQKTQNLRRLEAQRNALNARGNIGPSAPVKSSSLPSQITQRRTSTPTRARKLCRRSRESYGQKESPR